jgi:signal peptidase II
MERAGASTRVVRIPVLSSNVLEANPAVDPPTPTPGLGQRISHRIASRWRNDLVFFAIAAVIIIADQFTKSLVRANLSYGETWPENSDAFIRIIHVTNSGAAFGILQGQTPFLIVTSMLGLAAILLYYVYPPMDHGLIRIALGLQLGGAIGNFIDRVRLGEVTDFIDVGDFPTFNIADSSISISIVAVLAFFVLTEFQERDTAKHNSPGDAGNASHGDD